MNTAKITARPRKQKRKQESAGQTLFTVINYTVFTILMIICVFPFYYLFINTISSNDMVNRGLVLFYPRQITFQNYINVLKMDEFANALMISVSRTVIGTALGIFLSAYTAYLVTKRKMWHRKFGYRMIVVGMYVNAGVIAWYINMMNLGLLDNFLAYIVPGLIQPMNVIMTKTYIEQSVPDSLEEAAEIDGASIMTRFFKVVLPLCGPILATLTIFTAIGHWNNLQDTLLLMNDPKLYTLQFVLYQYMNQAAAMATAMVSSSSSSVLDNLNSYISPVTLRMTVAMVVVAPVLVVYPFFQRYFVKGIMIGAVKG